MIIDIRTRVIAGRDPFGVVTAATPSGRSVGSLGQHAPAAPHPVGHADPDPTSEGHRRAMGAVVDAAAIVGFRADRLGIHIPAEQVSAWVNELPDRRIGFAGIDASADSALDDVARAADLGCVGLSLSPADQGVRPTDDRVLAVLERAAAAQLPVIVANPALTTPASTLEFARPALLDEAARTTPGLTLILGDLAAGFLDETLLMIAKHPRVFAEISGVIARTWSLASLLLAAHERNVAGKLLFASGFPAEIPERAIERLYTLAAFRGPASASVPAVPREVIRGIVERDALAALGIDRGTLGLPPRQAPAQTPATHTPAFRPAAREFEHKP